MLVSFFRLHQIQVDVSFWYHCVCCFFLLERSDITENKNLPASRLTFSCSFNNNHWNILQWHCVSTLSIKSVECELIVEIGRSSSAIVLIISSLFVVAVAYSVVMKLSITSEFHRTLLERSSIVLGLGSIVTIVCKAFSQPILWDVPKSKLRGDPFQNQLLF